MKQPFFICFLTLGLGPTVVVPVDPPTRVRLVIPGQKLSLTTSYRFDTVLLQSHNINARWFSLGSASGQLLYEHTPGGYQHTLEDHGGRIALGRLDSGAHTTFFLNFTSVLPQDYGMYQFLLLKPWAVSVNFLVREIDVKVTEESGTNEVTENSSTHLHCSLFYEAPAQRPAPEVRFPWQDGAQFSFSWNLQNPFSLKNMQELPGRRDNISSVVLAVEEAAFTDAGQYECSVTPIGYSGDYVLRSTLNLSVAFSPRSPPKFLHRPSVQDLELSGGEQSAAFVIPFIAYPAPTNIKWTQISLDSNDGISVHKESMIAFSSDDSAALVFTELNEETFGKYQLSIDNGIGSPAVFYANVSSRGHHLTEDDPAEEPPSSSYIVLIVGVLVLICGLVLLGITIFLLVRSRRAHVQAPEDVKKVMTTTYEAGFPVYDKVCEEDSSSTRAGGDTSKAGDSDSHSMDSDDGFSTEYENDGVTDAVGLEGRDNLSYDV